VRLDERYWRADCRRDVTPAAAFVRTGIITLFPFSVPMVVGCRQWQIFQRGNNQHAIMTRFFCALLPLLLSAGTVAAYNTAPSTTTTNNKNALSSRRDWMNGLVAGAATGAVALLSDPQPAKAVISSKFCAYGTGDGCEDLAEGNEYIRQLQAKSAVNKETIILVRSCRYRVVPFFSGFCFSPSFFQLNYYY
jgi:hypothetical protein